MADSSIKHKTLNSVLWKILETGGTQFIQFVISVFLARLVLPDQFSAIAMMTIFIAVANVFVDSGFSNALIRKPERTQADCCTVFYFNIAIAIVAYLIIFAISPFVADFYNLPELKMLLKVMSLSIVINSFAAIHRTLFIAEMKFKVLAIYNMASLFVSGIIGVFLAYKGYQVWALVLHSLINAILSTIFVWFSSTWRPSFIFSRQSLKEFFGFGSKLLGSRLLDTIYNNIYGVVIGKVFARADLAFYNRAQALSIMTSSTPTNVLASVSYPALCKIQDDNDRIRDGYRKMISLSAFVIFPLCLGVGAVSYPLIDVLYTNIWIYAATLLQIIVFAGMWYPIHAINVNFLLVKGRSDLVFRIEILKKIVGVAILAATIPFGLEAMCYGSIVSSIICLVINTHYTGKFIGMGIIQQAKDFSPALILSLAMFVSCKALSTLMGNGLESLVASILLGFVIYLGGAIIFKVKGLQLLLNIRK